MKSRRKQSSNSSKTKKRSIGTKRRARLFRGGLVEDFDAFIADVTTLIESDEDSVRPKLFALFKPVIATVFRDAVNSCDDIYNLIIVRMACMIYAMTAKEGTNQGKIQYTDKYLELGKIRDDARKIIPPPETIVDYATTTKFDYKMIVLDVVERRRRELFTKNMDVFGFQSKIWVFQNSLYLPGYYSHNITQYSKQKTDKTTGHITHSLFYYVDFIEFLRVSNLSDETFKKICTAYIDMELNRILPTIDTAYLRQKIDEMHKKYVDERGNKTANNKNTKFTIEHFFGSISKLKNLAVRTADESSTAIKESENAAVFGNVRESALAGF